jgi:hypothetical protein
MHNNFERSSRNASAESNQRSRLRRGYGVAGRGSPRRMERAGWSRHRSHNLRGEGERAGCERINPSVGRSEVRHGESVRWRIRGPRGATPHLNPLLERGGEDGVRWPSRFGAAGAACFTVYAAFKVVTERLDRARRLQAEGSDSSFRRCGGDTRQSCHEQRALNRVG